MKSGFDFIPASTTTAVDLASLQAAIDAGKRIAAYYWWLFPNLMLNFYPWGLSINLVNPNGCTKTVVKYHGLIADQTKVGLGAGGVGCRTGCLSGLEFW